MAEENRKKHHRGRKKKKGGSNIVSNIILVIAIVVFAVSAYNYMVFFRSTIKGTKNTKRFRIWSSIQTRRMTRKKRHFPLILKNYWK